MNQSQFAVRLNDILYRRGDHGLTGSQVFRGLGGADVTGRDIARKGQDRHIPVGKILRQVSVAFGAEVVQVRSDGQVFRPDLDYGPKQDEMPVRPQSSEFADQVAVQPFVENTVE